MEAFTISVLLCHPSFFMLSAGYALMANDFFPLGKLIRAASQTKALEAAHATSLVFCILNFQVRLAPDGLDFGSLTSSALRNTTVLSLLRALAMRLTCEGVRTSFSFCNSPEPTMIKFAGAVMA